MMYYVVDETGKVICDLYQEHNAVGLADALNSYDDGHRYSVEAVSVDP